MSFCLSHCMQWCFHVVNLHKRTWTFTILVWWLVDQNVNKATSTETSIISTFSCHYKWHAILFAECWLVGRALSVCTCHKHEKLGLPRQLFVLSYYSGHCLPRWALWNLTFAIFIRCNLRLISCKNEMEPATDGKSLENRLKVSALAWASTLTPPTGYEPPEPPSADGLFCFYLRDRGHLRCCLTPNPTLTLFLWFLDETKVQRWHEEKAERKRSQMMRMLRVWRLETIYHPVM